MLLLFSDRLLECANIFVAADFDQKGIAEFIALNQTGYDRSMVVPKMGLNGWMMRAP
jgi:hypothetical protein